MEQAFSWTETALASFIIISESRSRLQREAADHLYLQDETASSHLQTTATACLQGNTYAFF